MRDHAMVSMCDERGHVIPPLSRCAAPRWRAQAQQWKQRLCCVNLENMMSNPNASLRLSLFHPHLHMLEPRAAHLQLPGKP